MELTQTQLDRAAGSLVGAAVGDALGVPYEFGAAHLVPGSTPRMIGGGLGPYAPGEWSDDTQMALCVTEALMNDGNDVSATLNAVASGFLGWMADGASDIGMQTREVLNRTWESMTDDQDQQPATVMSSMALSVHDRTGKSAGNGSLMRTAPVALRYLDDLNKMVLMARAISKLTHYDDLAADACVIWCVAIRRAILDGTLDGIDEGVGYIPAPRRLQWAEWIEEARAGKPGDFSNNGYVVKAFQAALSSVTMACSTALMNTTFAFGYGVTQAIYAGNDTDTVASITGALLGAMTGVALINWNWRAKAHGWPGVKALDLSMMGESLAQMSA